MRFYSLNSLTLLTLKSASAVIAFTEFACGILSWDYPELGMLIGLILACEVLDQKENNFFSNGLDIC